MNYVVAVSGGVDSVVLLDMLAKQATHNIIVAHFDHGIRAESDADARFVWELAKQYHLPFEVRREELGQGASELFARMRRYKFLQEIAKKYNAQIVTAHHVDDVIESIAINLVRGTGWRGLTVMSDTRISRPLIGVKKQVLYNYALKHGLEYVEDETNRDHSYTRNKLRGALTSLPDSSRHRIVKQRAAQQNLRHAIEREVSRFIHHTDRYFFIMIAEEVAVELLRAMTDARLTTPQLQAVLLQIKLARPGVKIEAGAGITIEIAKLTFRIT